MTNTDETTNSDPDAEAIEADQRRIKAAEVIVATRYGGSVRLSREDVLRQKYRNHVLRCTVEDAPDGSPQSVILKNVEGEGDAAYDPTNDTHGGTAWRFYNEWAGNRFLDALGLETPLSAGLIGGDRQAGLIVLQDLGKEGKSLADCMQGASQEELETALISYAASLGRLHAATTGKEEEFMSMRRECGGTEKGRAGEGKRWRTETVATFRTLCTTVEVTLPEGFESEADLVEKTIDNPGAFWAFSPGDACPDNHRLTESRYVRFFDFEFAGFTHAFLAAAYFYLPFPTCWCVNRLPGEMVLKMERAYREELATGCPEALDDAIFYPALLSACAFWTITTLTWGWEGMLEKDNTWGISTLWQRHLLRLSNFAEMSQQHNMFPALGETARLLRDALRERFADVEEMPLYQPFRKTADSE